MKLSNKIHFIGIGGIGMSGLARLFKSERKEVTGSDSTETENTKKLISEGISVVYEQKAENIKSKGSDPLLLPDLVVYTEAVSEDNEELVAARESGVRTINYFEALGEIANEYYLIAVAGTHGKTTTTAMLIDILEEASFDPTAIVGALRSKTGSNFRAGKSKYFIVEACEYKRDFLTLEPDMLVITNIEHEHVDYYKDLEDVYLAFSELVKKVPEDGFIIADLSDTQARPVYEGVRAKVVDYKDMFDPMLALPHPGMYNQLNAAAAKAAAVHLGIENKFIKSALENFAGTQRRFEYKGDYNNAPVYDDYAHHPTEINATISGVREMYPKKKLTIVFQPHTYSRTQELFDAFVDALAKADKVILVPIYAAREENKSGVSSEQIVQALGNKDVESEHSSTFSSAVASLKEYMGKNDIVVVMGAGDVSEIAIMLTSLN